MGSRDLVSPTHISITLGQRGNRVKTREMPAGRKEMPDYGNEQIYSSSYPCWVVGRLSLVACFLAGRTRLDGTHVGAGETERQPLSELWLLL